MFLIYLKCFARLNFLSTFVPPIQGAVAQLVEHRTENP
jgi:hypothetical protein